MTMWTLTSRLITGPIVQALSFMGIWQLGTISECIQSLLMVMLKHCVSSPCPASHPNRKLLLALIDFDWYHPNDGLAWLAVIRNKINFIHYLQFIPISYKIGNSVWGLIWCLRYKEDSKAEEFLGHKIPKVC